MADIRCFKHPQYRGTESPILSCKMCCSIYVSSIKEKRDEQHAAKEIKTNQASHDAYTYHPGTI